MKRLYKMKTTAIEKSFMQNQIKSRNIFLHTSIKNLENFNIKHLRWSKTDLSKEAKKDSKERHSMNFSSSRPEVYCSEGVFKTVAPCLFTDH